MIAQEFNGVFNLLIQPFLCRVWCTQVNAHSEQGFSQRLGSTDFRKDLCRYLTIPIGWISISFAFLDEDFQRC